MCRLCWFSRFQIVCLNSRWRTIDSGNPASAFHSCPCHLLSRALWPRVAVCILLQPSYPRFSSSLHMTSYSQDEPGCSGACLSPQHLPWEDGAGRHLTKVWSWGGLHSKTLSPNHKPKPKINRKPQKENTTIKIAPFHLKQLRACRALFHFYFFKSCVCLCLWRSGQLIWVLGIESGCHGWQQAPLPAEPFSQPSACGFEQGGLSSYALLLSP